MPNLTHFCTRWERNRVGLERRRSPCWRTSDQGEWRPHLWQGPSWEEWPEFLKLKAAYILFEEKIGPIIIFLEVKQFRIDFWTAWFAWPESHHSLSHCIIHNLEYRIFFSNGGSENVLSAKQRNFKLKIDFFARKRSLKARYAQKWKKKKKSKLHFPNVFTLHWDDRDKSPTWP